MRLSSVVFQGTARIRRRQYESSCRCLRKDKRPALFGSSEEGGGEHQSSAVAKGDHSPGLLCIQAREKQRTLGYPKAWNTQVNVPGLCLQQWGLAWLRPAMCQLIMPAGLDRRKEPLQKRASLYERITVRLPKNLICSYGG